MTLLSAFIKERTPLFNREMVEGLSYHRLNKGLEYIDSFIKYSTTGKTKTHLMYLGYRVVTPKEEYKLTVDGKKNKYMHDIAQSDLYVVEFRFKYTGIPEEKKVYMSFPFLSKGNTMFVSGAKFLISPVLADKVISIGDNIIFVNITTAKYNFKREFHVTYVNNLVTNNPIIKTELYRNQSSKMENTTKAVPTLIHYLLGVYGYDETMKKLLGFVPELKYGIPADNQNKVVIRSIGTPPKGYIKDKLAYRPTSICAIIDKKKNNENVEYIIGNLFYLLDNFPESITIEHINNPTIWRKLLGEIIHSGNYRLEYIMEKMNTHFKDLMSDLDFITSNKIRDVGYTANNVIELLVIILLNYNKWIMSSDRKTLYNTKAYETEIYALNILISDITKTVLDISKEELRINGEPLEAKDFNKIMDKTIKRRRIYRLRNDKLIVSSIEYSGDHLYPKNTAVITEQEANPINTSTEPDASTIERKKLIGSMITVGSILGLPKSNPTPVVRVNPYVTTEQFTNTVLPNPKYAALIHDLELKLTNCIDADTNIDISLLNSVDIDVEKDDVNDDEDDESILDDSESEGTFDD